MYTRKWEAESKCMQAGNILNTRAYYTSGRQVGNMPNIRTHANGKQKVGKGKQGNLANVHTHAMKAGRHNVGGGKESRCTR